MSPILILAQQLTSSSNIIISKTWSQEPSGYTYPISISVPSGAVPQGGFPVCILLHGNGGNGGGMVPAFSSTLACHILVAPSGYLNSWNISDESSEAPDIEMIEELVDTLQTFTNINPNKIRILGTSNGAALANRVLIENKDTGIDNICAIVSQLSEAQYHNGNFYYPSGPTGGTDPYDGYDSITTPITGRKYLSICNDNDQLIPYGGGPSVGVNFLNAQLATYIVAQSQGYTGAQTIGPGTPVGSAGSIVYEYSYLSGQVVHLRGNAGHTTNSTQLSYVTSFFNDCNNVVGVTKTNTEKLNLFPNPTKSFIKVEGAIQYPAHYTISNIQGQLILTGVLNSENESIIIDNLSSDIYIFNIDGRSFKVLKN